MVNYIHQVTAELKLPLVVPHNLMNSAMCERDGHSQDLQALVDALTAGEVDEFAISARSARG